MPNLSELQLNVLNLPVFLNEFWGKAAREYGYIKNTLCVFTYICVHAH